MYKVKIFKDGTTEIMKTEKSEKKHISFTTNKFETAVYKATTYLEQHQQVWDTIDYLESLYGKTKCDVSLTLTINMLKEWVNRESVF